MKKSLFLFAALLTSGCMVFAQKSNVSKASSALYMDPVNYDEARAAIAEAKVDETTASEPKTWYVAGRIGYTLANNEWNKRYINQMPDVDVLYTGLTEMYDNYIQADALDGKVLDKKGNPKYTQRKNIKGDFKEMLAIYYTVGSVLYDGNSFEKANDIFKDYLNIVDNPMFEAKDRIKVDSTYNDVKYKTCVSEVYISMNDSAKYIKALQNGFDLYPKDKFFVGSMVNYFIEQGNVDKALEYTDKLIEGDPDNVEYIGVKANLLIQLGRFDDAKNLLNESLSKQESETILYILGRCWTGEGDNIKMQAQDVVDNTEYNALMEKSKMCYGEAIKYFEKSKSQMNKDNGNYESLLLTMRNLYMQLNGAASPEYQAIDAELKTIQ